MAESRYNRDPFMSLLDFNSGHPVVTQADRSMITLSYRGEPLLWGRPRPTIIVVVFLLGFALVPLSALMCFGVLAWWAVYIDFGLMFSSVAIGVISLPIIRYRELHRRGKLDTAEFIAEGGLGGVPLPVVAELRLALGRSFAVDPDLILPWDNKKTLYKLAMPYAFEVIVSSARALDIELSDADVYRISLRVPKEAKSVADLVKLVSEEFSRKKFSLLRPEKFEPDSEVEK